MGWVKNNESPIENVNFERLNFETDLKKNVPGITLLRIF